MKRVLTTAVLAGTAGSIPSTLLALATGGDWMAPVNAVAAMAGAQHLALLPRLCAAAGVHFAISAVWVWLLFALLPGHRTVIWAMAAGIMVAAVDLLILAPLFFAGVASLPLFPQFVDHIVWGATAGALVKRRAL